MAIWKISRTLKVSSSAVAKTITSTMMKLAHTRTATGMEDPELTLLKSSSNRHISTSTVQRRLWIRPPWSICCKETTTKGHQ
jgi:hypothetical protein